MASNSRYGRLGKPEYKSPARADTDVLGALGSAYEIFKKAIRPLQTGTDHGNREWYRVNQEAAYGEACALLKGMKDVGSPYGVGDHIFSRGGAYHAVGIFLSAVLNTTSINEIVITAAAKNPWEPKIDFIGYMLPEGKRLIIGKGVDADCAGDTAKGDIYMWGNPDIFAMMSEGGLQCNMGRNCRHLGVGVLGGVQINFGEVEEIAMMAEAGVQIDAGRSGAHEFYRHNGSVVIKALGGLCNLVMKHEARTLLGTDGEKGDMAEYFFEKLHELDFLKMPDFDSETLKRIRAFDSGKYVSEISSIAAKMKEYAAEKYGKEGA